ncbi:MAG: DNA gyrase C-terminal beta-propeller domain-containing protein, partial [Patescibacteria group bacterium]
EHFILTNTHDNLLFFTNSGKVFQTKAYEIPEGTRTAKGKSVVNFLSLAQNETITSILNYADKIDENKFQYLFMATKNGIIKKTPLEDFKTVRRNGLIALKLKKDDVLRAVLPTSGRDEIILTSGNGQAVRFSEKDARPMGRNAAGTKGMRLKKQDEVNGACVIAAENKDDNLLIIMENGYGKQTPLKEYKKQKRGGSGIKTAKITEKTGKIVAAKILGKEVSELIAISKKGQVIRTTLETISALGRATQGVRIMKLESGDKVASITCL